VEEVRLYIGIDDTDNKESRGTGFRARKLAGLLTENKLARVEGITRHQLFVDPRIPYTSQNSSACLVVSACDRKKLMDFCRTFLLEDSADGSDVGLCIAEESQLNKGIIEWGRKAKSEVLNQEAAYKMANHDNLYLEGLTGTKDGIIGALAAVGLCYSGNDGRFILIENIDLREIKGLFKTSQILDQHIADKIMTTDKRSLINNENIFMGEWVRPLLKESNKVLIVEKSENTTNYEWQIASKDYIKSISQ